MAEYIEREALLDSIGLIQLHFVAHGDNKSLFDIINEQPSADVAPVRHGRWNADETCPFCGKKSTEGLDAEKWDYWFPAFCPNCGCRMDLSEGGTHDT